jgi:hypothetical protein
MVGDFLVELITWLRQFSCGQDDGRHTAEHVPAQVDRTRGTFFTIAAPTERTQVDRINRKIASAASGAVNVSCPRGSYGHSRATPPVMSI